MSEAFSGTGMYEDIKPIKILAIGNGFDLAHELKTTYYAFLDCCNSIRKFRSSPAIYGPIDEKRHDLIKNCGKDIYDEFDKLIDSFWIIHFEKRRKELRNAWISFESEIEKTVSDEYNYFRGKRSNAFEGTFTSTLSAFISKIRDEIKTNQDVFILLYDELKKLNRALEIYLDVFTTADLKDAKKLEVISKIGPDYVLSFNYTNTFSKVYGKKEICFIHGNADSSRDILENNMILGYDKRYLKDEDNFVEGIPFQKYYQRVVKHTDNNYYKWLENNDNLEKWRRRKIKLYFFGHSLSPADGDVIRLLVTNEMAYTTIYYRTNQQGELESLVQNMAFVLGREKFVSLAGGSKPRIIFEGYEEGKLFEGMKEETLI